MCLLRTKPLLYRIMSLSGQWSMLKHNYKPNRTLTMTTKKKNKKKILPDGPPTLTWLVGFQQTGGPSYCDLWMICQRCPFSPLLWYFFRSYILPTHKFVILFSSNICAWINNNANILYLWFKTILKVCFITCIAVLPWP
jgi:hypothetical protein